jgi:hypothetical protein
MSPCLKSIDNHKEFMIVDVIVLFCWGEQMGFAFDRSKSSPFVLLQKDGSSCELGCIYLQKKGSFIVGLLEYQICGHCMH